MKTTIEIESGSRIEVHSWNIYGLPLVVTEGVNSPGYRITNKHTGHAASGSFTSVERAKKVAKAFWHSLTETQQRAVERGTIPKFMRATLLRKLNAAEKTK